MGPEGNTHAGPLLASIDKLAEDHVVAGSPVVELYRGHNPFSGKLVLIHYFRAERMLRVGTYYADTEYSQDKPYIFTINEDNQVSYQAW